MLSNEEAGLDSASLRDLRSMTDLARRITKATAQAIGHSMSSLIMLERHLWLTMMEMKEADKVPFLDPLVSSGSLFLPAVESFAEHFTEAQKSSRAMQDFLPKRTNSSSASSCPRPAPTQRTAKPTQTDPEPRPPQDRLGSGASKILVNSQAERGGAESRYRWTTPQAASIVPLNISMSYSFPYLRYPISIFIFIFKKLEIL